LTQKAHNMRFFAALPLLASSCTFAQIQISQNPLTGDCRLSPDSLRPIVPPFWPYMYRYEWDPRTKTETLYLSPQKQLRIEQRACNRHHITYELRVPLTYPLTPSLTQGLVSLLDTILTRLHQDNPDFLTIKDLVLPRLLAQLQIRSIGDVAMVPYQEWNFLAQIDTDRSSAYIRLETIRYISSQAIRKPGVPDYMDDAWQK
jgi:hypothetical protein